MEVVDRCEQTQTALEVVRKRMSSMIVLLHWLVTVNNRGLTPDESKILELVVSGSLEDTEEDGEVRLCLFPTGNNVLFQNNHEYHCLKMCTDLMNYFQHLIVLVVGKAEFSSGEALCVPTIVSAEHFVQCALSNGRFRSCQSLKTCLS